MRKYHIYLTPEERKLIIESLISEKNTLISAGKYTDCIDDILLKILQAKKKKVTAFGTKESVGCALFCMSRSFLLNLSEQCIWITTVTKYLVRGCTLRPCCTLNGFNLTLIAKRHCFQQ